MLVLLEGEGVVASDGAAARRRGEWFYTQHVRPLARHCEENRDCRNLVVLFEMAEFRKAPADPTTAAKIAATNPGVLAAVMLTIYWRHFFDLCGIGKDEMARRIGPAVAWWGVDGMKAIHGLADVPSPIPAGTHYEVLADGELSVTVKASNGQQFFALCGLASKAVVDRARKTPWPAYPKGSDPEADEVWQERMKAEADTLEKDTIGSKMIGEFLAATRKPWPEPPMSEIGVDGKARDKGKAKAKPKEKQKAELFA